MPGSKCQLCSEPPRRMLPPTPPSKSTFHWKSLQIIFEAWRKVMISLKLLMLGRKLTEDSSQPRMQPEGCAFASGRVHPEPASFRSPRTGVRSSLWGKRTHDMQEGKPTSAIIIRRLFNSVVRRMSLPTCISCADRKRAVPR